MHFDARLRLFLALSAVFVTCLLVGDIIGGKLIEVSALGRPWVISVGMIPFPITFLLTDLLNEFYGKKAARQVTFLGFFMAILAFALIYAAAALPMAPFTAEPSWEGVRGESFDNVFAGSQRILFASMVAYLTAQLTDIAVFAALKKRTGGKYLWLRATGSTTISQAIDTAVIQTVAWIGLLPLERIVEIALASYAVKLVVAVGLTPLIYAGHALVERRLGIEPVPPDVEPVI